MKQLFFFAIFLLSGFAHAQISATVPALVVAIQPSYPIQVTINKTANLVFPYEIKSVDRGTEHLLVQKVVGAGHILQVKAASADMPETSLSVVTADLQLYNFLVRFDSSPTTLNYRIKAPDPSPSVATPFTVHKLNEAQIKIDAAQVASYQPTEKQVRDSRYGIALIVNGIYVHENILYFFLQLENGTTLNYDIESLQVFIRDKETGKRTARQEINIPVLYSHGDTAFIGSNSSQRLVVAVPKFTIPNKKDCLLQLQEGGGGRHLECKIKNKRLIHCKPLDN